MEHQQYSKVLNSFLSFKASITALTRSPVVLHVTAIRRIIDPVMTNEEI